MLDFEQSMTSLMTVFQKNVLLQNHTSSEDLIDHLSSKVDHASNLRFNQLESSIMMEFKKLALRNDQFCHNLMEEMKEEHKSRIREKQTIQSRVDQAVLDMKNTVIEMEWRGNEMNWMREVMKKVVE